MSKTKYVNRETKPYIQEVTVSKANPRGLLNKFLAMTQLVTDVLNSGSYVMRCNRNDQQIKLFNKFISEVYLE